jgi:hypothetical protein
MVRSTSAASDVSRKPTDVVVVGKRLARTKYLPADGTLQGLLLAFAWICVCGGLGVSANECEGNCMDGEGTYKFPDGERECVNARERASEIGEGAGGVDRICAVVE